MSPRPWLTRGLLSASCTLYTEHSDDPACAAAWAQLLTQASNVQVVS